MAQRSSGGVGSNPTSDRRFFRHDLDTEVEMITSDINEKTHKLDYNSLRLLETAEGSKGPESTDTCQQVTQCASCYAQCSVQPLQLFGKTANCNYLALISYRGPRSAPRPRLTRHAPKMTLRQICRLLKVMKQVKTKEAAAAATTRKPGSAAPVSSPIIRSDKKCLPVCFRRKRNISIKRAG